MADSVDELFEVRTMFWLGAYQQAITAANKCKPKNEQDKIQRDVYVYRSYLALNQPALVTGEINDKSPLQLQAVRVLATLTSDPNSTAALEALKTWSSDPATITDQNMQLICGSAFYLLGNTDEALRCIHQPNSLESMALAAQVLLAINRLPMAEQMLAQMQSADDDAVITQITGAWGSEKCQDAFNVFQELTEKYNPTSLLLNGMAVACMHMARFSDAEKMLLEALEKVLHSAQLIIIPKAPNDPNTTINLLVCNLHLHRPPEIINRYITQLKAVKYPLAAKLVALEAGFDEAVASVDVK